MRAWLSGMHRKLSFFLTFFSSARIENEAERGRFLFGLGSQKVQISQGPIGKPWIWIDDVAEYQPLRNCMQISTCQKNDICCDHAQSVI